MRYMHKVPFQHRVMMFVCKLVLLHHYSKQADDYVKMVNHHYHLIG